VVIVVALLIAQISGAAAVLAWLDDDAAAPAAAEPAWIQLNPDAKLSPAPSPTPSPTPKPVVKPKPAPVVQAQKAAPKASAKPKKHVDRLASLRGLGTWVDLYDYGSGANKPVGTLVAQAASHQVSTIWVETSRYNTADIKYPAALGELMDASHARGIKVIAWVLPEFRSVSADLAKAKAAAAFRSPRGHRFAALGLDIEVSTGAKADDRNARLKSLTRKVYGHIGMPTIAIVPPPVGFSRHPEYWPNFPWRDVGAHADAIATMGYWSFSNAEAGSYTADTIKQTRSLVGKASYPVHVIGGLAEDTTPAGAAAFCRAASSGRALGASLYDLTSMPASLWSPLQACRKVGH
jgi:hypothetical protein